MEALFNKQQYRIDSIDFHIQSNCTIYVHLSNSICLPAKLWFSIHTLTALTVGCINVCLTMTHSVHTPSLGSSSHRTFYSAICQCVCMCVCGGV